MKILSCIYLTYMNGKTMTLNSNTIKRHYQNKKTTDTFLIYQISTGNLYICSDKTTSDSNSTISEKLKNLTQGNGKTLLVNVILLGLTFDNDVLIDLEELTHRSLSCNGNKDFVIRKNKPGELSFLDFIRNEYGILKLTAKTIVDYRVNKKPFIEKMLKSLIDFANSDMLVQSTSAFAKDVGLSNIRYLFDEFTNHVDGIYWLQDEVSDNKNKLTIGCSYDELTENDSNFHPSRYFNSFDFELKPVVVINSGITLNTFEIIQPSS